MKGPYFADFLNFVDPANCDSSISPYPRKCAQILNNGSGMLKIKIVNWGRQAMHPFKPSRLVKMVRDLRHNWLLTSLRLLTYCDYGFEVFSRADSVCRSADCPYFALNSAGSNGSLAACLCRSSSSRRLITLLIPVISSSFSKGEDALLFACASIFFALKYSFARGPKEGG